MSPQIIIDPKRQRLMEQISGATKLGFGYLSDALRCYRRGRPISGDMYAHEARGWYIFAAHLGRILQGWDHE